MARAIHAILTLGSAAPTALILDYIAQRDLGASGESVRTQALILAAAIGVGLVGNVLQKNK
jgi:hypothetical protein